MRPDEHKKKRSAQYKKKHGISEKKESDKKTDKKKDKEESTSDPSSSKSSQVNTRGENDKTVDENPDASISKTYRRRQIESNWSRYEDLPPFEDQAPQRRGESFQKLLDAAGGSLAQFKLKDEQDWELDEPKTHDSGGFLTIDFEDISAALSCIPLHERLGLSEDLFSETQLEEIHSVAKISAASYSQSAEAKQQREEKKSGSQMSAVLSQKKECETREQCDIDSLLNVDEKDSKQENIHGDKQLDVESSEAKKTTNVKELKPRAAIVKPAVVLDSSNLEDDLDFLLGLDKPSQDSGKPVEDVDKSEHLITNDSSETELKPKTPVAANKGQNVPSKVIVADNTEDDLDWLDSVLDS